MTRYLLIALLIFAVGCDNFRWPDPRRGRGDRRRGGSFGLAASTTDPVEFWQPKSRTSSKAPSPNIPPASATSIPIAIRHVWLWLKPDIFCKNSLLLEMSSTRPANDIYARTSSSCRRSPLQKPTTLMKPFTPYKPATIWIRRYRTAQELFGPEGPADRQPHERTFGTDGDQGAGRDNALC